MIRAPRGIIELFDDEENKKKIDHYFDLAFAMSAGDSVWSPQPGPQTMAYNSEADVLGYGGAAGGGKTALLLGLAATAHTRSVIFRRIFPNLRGVIEESRVIFNPTGDPKTQDTFNESLHRWNLDGASMLEFESCQHEKDKEKQRGRPRDFYGFDEATEFTKSMVGFITAWNRTTIPDQRCRVVLTFNPPTDDDGAWVVDYFLPWLAYLHPEKFKHDKPAAPGELRYFTTIDGNEIERPDNKPFEYDGETLIPQSRTFIPARLEDNKYLSGTNYRANLMALEEPLRSQLLYGDFSAIAQDNPWQLIKPDWVDQAVERWHAMEFERHFGAPDAIGVDIARGGKASTAFAKRYGTFFDRIIKLDGVDTPDGQSVAKALEGVVVGQPDINIDVIGVGAAAYDICKGKWEYVNPVNVASKSDKKDKTGQFTFKNLRSALYWLMREALDPSSGALIALPPDPELKADLCAPTYKYIGTQIMIEPKESISQRLGRSPDVGDAVILSTFEPERDDMSSEEW